jgi:hypothetical protein
VAAAAAAAVAVAVYVRYLLFSCVYGATVLMTVLLLWLFPGAGLCLQGLLGEQMLAPV